MGSTAIAERGLEHLDETRIRELLGPSGPLASTLPGFECREAQLDMAASVAACFRDGGQLLVEAGTGTGKTLAYLIPAVLSGQRVVISTGTKNLQEQLFYKDIPILRKALAVPFTACLMKGRGNYLCLKRYAEFELQPAFRLFEEEQHFPALRAWAETTQTGDRADIPGFPDRLDFWKNLSARSENCVGKECPDFDLCYVTRLRKRAAESDIIVVNHHLLFADLMVREGSYGEVIPEYDFVVLDEAHQIEDVATAYFGLTVSTASVNELVRDLEASWKSRSSGSREPLTEIQRLRAASDGLFETFRRGDGTSGERYRLQPGAETRAQELAANMFRRQLERVRRDLAAMPQPDETTVALARRAGELEMDLETILATNDPESVFWCEIRERSIALRAAPIHIAPLVERMLYEKKYTVVLTSATLAVERSFEYASRRLGVSTERTLLLDSPFDFHRQALMYVPRHLPQPRSPDFVDRALDEIRRLLGASGGRAFVLFTSFFNLNAVRRGLASDCPYPLLVQGDAPRGEILERFRSTEGAVLLATSSFWEGVDVVGEQLSCVIIDKLPFAVPNDPLVAARVEWTESRGGSGFNDYQVPMAILSLKQGLGRLIRSTADRGVVAVLDSRLQTMGYGRRFRASLPPFRTTHDFAEVERFFASVPQSDTTDSEVET